MPSPLISILIVCRNPGPSLRDALQSAWDQQSADFEIVVVDGASTDGSAEWLAGVRQRIAALHSGPDAGIYDAMNHALRLARGDWVLFLGADDVLASADVLAHAAPELAVTSASVLVGEARYTDGRRYPFTGTRTAIRRNFVHHQAAFYRRAALIDFGPFDASLQIMGDYDINLRLLLAGARFDSLPLLVAVCGTGGASDAGGWIGYREEIRVRHRHFPVARCLLWDCASIARCLRKRSIRALRRSNHG